MIPVPQDVNVLNALVDKYFQKEQWEQDLTSNTSDYKAVSDYSGVPLDKVQDLPYAQYKLYLRDAWLANMSKSEDGRKFLETCWRIRQTSADEKAIEKYQRYGGDV